MHLRKALFNIVADIEHFAKVDLLKDFSSNNEEDGYAIVAKYLESNPRIKSEFNQHSKYSYSHDLISKYKNNFALWNIVEVLTFNNFIGLYKLYYENNKTKRKNFNFLWSVKALRNAIAHNNCLINKLNRMGDSSFKKNNHINSYIAQHIPSISEMSRNKKMNVPFINDFVVTIHLFNHIVTSKQIRCYAMGTLNDLINKRFYLHIDYFKDNQIITSSFKFLKDILDYYYKDSI